MTNISVPNPSISNSSTADVTLLTANDNAIVSGLTDTTKDISVSAITAAGLVTAGASIKLGSANSIKDAGGNELISFPSTVGSAVNELTISNAATTTNPTISATGDDANIGITVTPKGRGDILLDANTIFNGDNQLTTADFPNTTTLYGNNMDATSADAANATYGAGGGGTKFGTSGGKDLTVKGQALASGNDVLGNAKYCQFAGSGYLQSTDAAYDLSGNFSLVDWFLLPTWSPASTETLISNASSATAGFRYDITTAGNLVVYEDATTPFGATGISVAGLDATKYHQIVITRTSGGTITLYIDGNLVASATSGTITIKALMQISGYNGATQLVLTGTRVDEHAVHIGTVLTADQVKAIYARSAKKFAVKDQNSNIFIPELNVASGVYTPTLTNTTNVAASTASPMSWTRIGNVITVNFQAAIDPTAAADTVLDFTFPIACSSTPTVCYGSACGDDASSAALLGMILAHSATQARFNFYANDTSNNYYRGIFQYVLN